MDLTGLDWEPGTRFTDAHVQIMSKIHPKATKQLFAMFWIEIFVKFASKKYRQVGNISIK